MTDSADELIDLIKQGDMEALGQFLELRRPQLMAFINKNLSDNLRRKVEADDIFSEVSINALNSLHEMQLGDRDPFSWLCQLAERRIIDAHRRFFGAKKRTASKEVGLQSSSRSEGDSGAGGGFIDVLVASMTSPSQAFSREQREFKLHEALQELTAEQQAAIRMRYVEGLPTKEIAEKLGKTDGSVRVMLTRSLAKLHKVLGDDTHFRDFRGPADRQAAADDEE